MSTSNSDPHSAAEIAGLLGRSFPGHTMQRMRSPDGEYRYSYVSPGVRNFLGLDPDELMQRDAVDHAWLQADDRLVFLAALEKSARELSTLDEEVRVIQPDGGYKWVRSIGHPRRMPDGAVVWDGVALDVTDRRDAIEALERTLRQARRNEASEGRFSFIAANDVQVHFLALKEAVTGLLTASYSDAEATRGAVEAMVDRFHAYERAVAAARDLMAAGASGDSAPTGDAPARSLTSRQVEILNHVRRGASNRTIAEALGISEGTVKLHVSAILKRLGARNRTEATHILFGAE